MGDRVRSNRASRCVARLLITLVLCLVGVGCVTRSTRRVGADPATIRERHNLEFTVPPGWSLSEAPMHFLDSVQLDLRSPDGLVAILEVTPGEAPKLATCVEDVRRAYGARFPNGRFHPVQAGVGPYPAAGFDGSVVTAGAAGRRINFLYRCFNASGRFASIQGQASAAVWGARRGELDTLLRSIRVGPVPRAE